MVHCWVRMVAGRGTVEWKELETESHWVTRFCDCGQVIWPSKPHAPHLQDKWTQGNIFLSPASTMGNSWLFILPLFFSPYAIALNRVARLAKPVKQIYFYFALLLELLFLTKHARVEAMLFINNVTFFWDTLFLVLAKSPFFFPAERAVMHQRLFFSS